MKKNFTIRRTIVLFATILFNQALSAQKEIIITNSSAVNLSSKGIAITRAHFRSIPSGAVYPVVLSQKGDTIPAQLDDLDGDNRWDELFLVAPISASSTERFSIKWVNTKPEFPKRTSVRFGKRTSATTPVKPALTDTMLANQLPKSIGYQAYQTDGPSWENDKVGFRHYLDGRNAKDVFGKKVSYMSPDSVGINASGAVEDNYHVMETWGRDILAVGNSIGIGGIALSAGGKLLRLGVTVNDSVNNVEKTEFRILTEGPVRSMLQFRYNNWNPASRNYTVEETTSIWPGMYAYHNTVKFSGLQGNENLMIGLVNINSEKALTEIKTGKWVILLSHDKHTYNKEWWLGLALILPAADYLGYTEAPKTGNLSNSFLARMKVTNGRPVSYFAVAGWELSEEGFKDPDYFRNYVNTLAKELAAEVKITVK